MRKLLLVVCALAVIALIVTGSSRKFGRPRVVHRDTQMLGSIGKMVVVIHKDEWPNIWQPSLDYEVTIVGESGPGAMIMTETVKMDFKGTSHVILNCVGIFTPPEPKSVCNSPDLGLQPPSLIKSFREHLDVYQVVYDELAKQLDETKSQLDRTLQTPPDLEPTPTASPTIY